MNTTERTAARTPIHANTEITPAQIARAGINHGTALAALDAASQAANDLIHAHTVQTQISPATHDRLRAAARALREAIAAAEQEAHETYDLMLESL